jgi:hypothetical protein
MSMMKNAVLVYKFDGAIQQLHVRKVALESWEQLRSMYGMTSTDLITEFGTGDELSKYLIIWLTRRQENRSLRWQDVRRELQSVDHEFEVVGVVIDGVVEFGDEDEVAAAIGADPNPTKTA